MPAHASRFRTLGRSWRTQPTLGIVSPHQLRPSGFGSILCASTSVDSGYQRKIDGENTSALTTGSGAAGFWHERVRQSEPMKQHDANRHPGPWRVMRVDSEFAGLLVAVGFVVMGLVSMPIATWFLLGALVLGVGVALLLRCTRKG